MTYPKLTREWQGVTLEDISNQWQKSKDVHPSFGAKLGHFAAGIDRLLKERNYTPNQRSNKSET